MSRYNDLCFYLIANDLNRCNAFSYNLMASPVACNFLNVSVSSLIPLKCLVSVRYFFIPKIMAKISRQFQSTPLTTSRRGAFAPTRILTCLGICQVLLTSIFPPNDGSAYFEIYSSLSDLADVRPLTQKDCSDKERTLMAGLRYTKISRPLSKLRLDN